MAERIATWIVAFAAAYLAAGAIFALAFLARGIERVDPAAHGSTRGFRLLIAPGVMAFWPLLAWKWRLAVRMLEGETGS